MTILDTFFVLFKSDTKELDKGMDDADKKSKGLLESLKQTATGADGLGKTLKDLAMQGAALFGVSLSLKFLYDNVKENAEAMIALDKLAARMNTTAAAVDEFIDTGALLGLKEDVTKGGLEALNTAAQDTALGMGRAKKVFEELGISVTDAAGKVKPITGLMTELSVAFKDMDKGKQIRVMERLGMDPALLKLFNADLVALGERLEKIDKAAGFNFERLRTLSGAYLKESNAFKVELNSIFTFFEKLRSASYTEFLPIITKGLQFLTKIAHELFEYIINHADFVKGALIAISTAIMYFLIPAAIQGAIAFATMLAPFLLVGAAVAAVIAAFALMYEDLQVYLEGGDSLLGRFLPKWDELKGKIDGVTAAWKMATGEWVGDAELWEGAWKKVLRAMDLDTAESVAAWMKNFGAFKDYLMGIANDVKQVFQDIIDAINKVFAMLGVSGGAGGFASDIKASLGDTIDMLKKGAQQAGSTNWIDEAMSLGKEMLGRVGESPISSTSSSAISNSTNRTSNTTVDVGGVTVQTQATDTEGISKTIGNSLSTQMKQAVSHFDDGVVA